MPDFASSNELFQHRNRLQQCRVSQLSSACRYYGIKKAGSKQELVERLVEFLTSASRDDRYNLSRALDSESQPNGTANSRPATSLTPSRSREATQQPSGNDVTRNSIDGNSDVLTREQKIIYASIDPFHPIANISNPFLFYRSCYRGSVDFPLNLPELKALRRQGYSVWLRGTCKNSPKGERQKWPNELRICVNNVRVGTVEPPKRLKKRRDEPIDLTRYLQSGLNNINLAVFDDNASQFNVAIVVCANLTDRTIMGLVPPQSEESAKERMLTILSVKSDIIEDTTEGYRSLDLRCPIGLSRLKIPVRGFKCDHIRCFDLVSYVSVNRSTSNINLRWLCPICHSYVLPNDLLIDSYIYSILRSTPPTVEEILLSEKDGSWMLNPNPKETGNSNTDDEMGEGSSQRKRSSDSDTTQFEEPDFDLPPEPHEVVVELSDGEGQPRGIPCKSSTPSKSSVSMECEVIDLD